MRTKRVILVIVAIAVLIAGILTQISLFVVPPIGAIPDGRTLVLSRSDATRLVDSPDAMCQRIQGSVSLLCRGLVLGQVVENSRIYARLPYSESLYLISTGGITYFN